VAVSTPVHDRRAEVGPLAVVADPGGEHVFVDDTNSRLMKRDIQARKNTS